MSNTNEDLETKKDDEKDEKEEVLEASESKKETKEEKKEDKSPEVEAYKKAIADAEIERIRKEEKDKLYPSIEKYKADAKLAEEAKKAAEDKLREYETSKLTLEEQAAIKLAQLEESNIKLQAQIEDLVKEANDKITTLQLELVKKEILAKYGDEIIPALVNGSTIEEIAESAEKAHNEYVAIRDRELEKSKAAVKPKEQIGSRIAPTSDKLNAGITVKDIKDIKDPVEWAKVHDTLVEEALKQF